MDRKSLQEYITKTYGTRAEYPWEKYPSFSVFRHVGNKKWFAVVMKIPASKLGIENQEFIEIINLKVPPYIIGGILCESFIFPAYHMNKRHWISVILDGSVPNDFCEMLIGKSYDLTKPKRRK